MIQIIDSVEIAELDKYTANRLVGIVNTFNLAKQNKNEDLQKQLWCVFYETELLRMELNLPPLHFVDKATEKIYTIMLHEARHFVIYAEKSLVRETSPNNADVERKK